MKKMTNQKKKKKKTNLDLIFFQMMEEKLASKVQYAHLEEKLFQVLEEKLFQMMEEKLFQVNIMKNDKKLVPIFFQYTQSLPRNHTFDFVNKSQDFQILL